MILPSGETQRSDGPRWPGVLLSILDERVVLHAVMDSQTILVEALDDERKAEAAYEAIIERFGEVRPFINIDDGEARHSRAMERQMERLGMAVKLRL